MPQHSIETLEIDLGRYMDELYNEFIRDWIPAQPEHQPQQFQHQVKTYCVLAHAAFEEFIEAVSLWVMQSAIDEWQGNRRATNSLLSLCLFYGVDISAVEDENSVQDRCFDAVRVALQDAKNMHSKAIFDNHGFSLKYLRNALTPIYVDIILDTKEAESLRTLADARGSYAHNASKLAVFVDQKKAQHPMPPEKARDLVADCLGLCKKIAAQAERHFPAPAAVIAGG